MLPNRIKIYTSRNGVTANIANPNDVLDSSGNTPYVIAVESFTNRYIITAENGDLSSINFKSFNAKEMKFYNGPNSDKSRFLRYNPSRKAIVYPELRNLDLSRMETIPTYSTFAIESYLLFGTSLYLAITNMVLNLFGTIIAAGTGYKLLNFFLK